MKIVNVSICKNCKHTLSEGAIICPTCKKTDPYIEYNQVVVSDNWPNEEKELKK